MNEWYTNSFMIDFAAAYELNKWACTQNSYSLLDRCLDPGMFLVAREL